MCSDNRLRSLNGPLRPSIIIWNSFIGHSNRVKPIATNLIRIAGAAGFDLALGRVLAMRVRAFGYNVLLADMKVNPRAFEKEGSNMWTLRSSDNVDAGPQVRVMHEKALEYLNRVIKDHPSTPWARLAEVELREPFGWSWHEGVMPVPQPGMDNDNGGPRFAPEDEERNAAAQARNRLRDATRPKL